jgi:hypothetical protein
MRFIQARVTRVVSIALFGLISAGCSSPHYGTYPNGLSDFPSRPVSAAEAVKAAEPYLDQTFTLCRAARRYGSTDAEPYVRVKLEGKTYKVLKDNFLSKNADYGFSHAVKVDAVTGEVTPPR